MIQRLIDLFGREKKPEEVVLQKEVVEERQKFEVRRARANRVLRDFYAADAVVRGSHYRGPNGA